LLEASALNNFLCIGALRASQRDKTMTYTNIFRFFSMLFTGVTMSASFAHLFELLNKINLPREDYLTVQHIYNGWALLGFAVVGALFSASVLTVLVRDNSRMFWLTLTAAICIALGLVVFFLFTYPVNMATLNWTTMPDNWEALRRQWEYSHAIAAVLYFTAFITLTLSLLVEPEPCGPGVTDDEGSRSVM